MTHLTRRILVVPVILGTVLASSVHKLSLGSHVSAATPRAHAAKTVRQLTMEVVVRASNSPYWQTVILGAKKAAAQTRCPEPWLRRWTL